LRREGLDLAGPWAVLHPGATAPSRRYVPEGFAETARRLGDLGWGLVFTGGPSEIELVDRARDGVPSVSLAGRLDVAELAALLEMAPVLIANNSGPVHLAAAVGTPVVDLYALTNPQHTPWGVAHRVLSHDVECRWCYSSVCPMGHHDCLARVTPGEVVAAARSLVEAPPTVSAPEGGPHPVARVPLTS
jgi:ADP-heptose:LPS heptosyltransferase